MKFKNFIVVAAVLQFSLSAVSTFAMSNDGANNNGAKKNKIFTEKVEGAENAENKIENSDDLIDLDNIDKDVKVNDNDDINILKSNLEKHGKNYKSDELNFKNSDLISRKRKSDCNFDNDNVFKMPLNSKNFKSKESDNSLNTSLFSTCFNEYGIDKVHLKKSYVLKNGECLLSDDLIRFEKKFGPLRSIREIYNIGSDKYDFNRYKFSPSEEDYKKIIKKPYLKSVAGQNEKEKNFDSEAALDDNTVIGSVYELDSEEFNVKITNYKDLKLFAGSGDEFNKVIGIQNGNALTGPLFWLNNIVGANPYYDKKCGKCCFLRLCFIINPVFSKFIHKKTKNDRIELFNGPEDSCLNEEGVLEGGDKLPAYYIKFAKPMCISDDSKENDDDDSDYDKDNIKSEGDMNSNKADGAYLFYINLKFNLEKKIEDFANEDVCYIWYDIPEELNKFFASKQFKAKVEFFDKICREANLAKEKKIEKDEV